MITESGLIKRGFEKESFYGSFEKGSINIMLVDGCVNQVFQHTSRHESNLDILPIKTYKKLDDFLKFLID